MGGTTFSSPSVEHAVTRQAQRNIDATTKLFPAATDRILPFTFKLLFAKCPIFSLFHELVNEKRPGNQNGNRGFFYS